MVAVILLTLSLLFSVVICGPLRCNVQLYSKYSTSIKLAPLEQLELPFPYDVDLEDWAEF